MDLKQLEEYCLSIGLTKMHARRMWNTFDGKETGEINEQDAKEYANKLLKRASKEKEADEDENFIRLCRAAGVTPRPAIRHKLSELTDEEVVARLVKQEKLASICKENSIDREKTKRFMEHIGWDKDIQCAIDAVTYCEKKEVVWVELLHVLKDVTHENFIEVIDKLSESFGGLEGVIEKAFAGRVTYKEFKKDFLEETRLLKKSGGAEGFTDTEKKILIFRNTLNRHYSSLTTSKVEEAVVQLTKRSAELNEINMPKG